MNRVPLNPGDEIRTNTTYTVTAVTGMGANCIVYDAYFLDSRGNRKMVRIKESYPTGMGITRNGQCLCWPSEEEKKTARNRFEESYRISAEIQNDAGLQRTGIYTLDIFEANNTVYMVVIPDHGVSYDKYLSDDVTDAVKTALALTRVVSLYHQKGYLHLDIKPGNFIALDDSTGKGKNIILFDTDTLMPMEALRNGQVRFSSYSKGWAAPEQAQQKLSRLCPATDLFAVGAVLFQRVIGRPVSSEDMGVLAEWSYDQRLTAKTVNSAVRRILTEVFHKTLAANVKRRYSSATELAEALEQILELLTGRQPYVISSLAPMASRCIGRENELEELSEALSECAQVFIRGDGGIGKSTLARAYAELHRKDYDAVVFLRYDSSTTVEELLRTVPMGNISANDDRYEALQVACNNRTLIIMDNLDINPMDEDLDALLELECHCMITTRSDFQEYYPKIPVIHLYGLDRNSLFVLFEQESGVELTEEDRKALNPILRLSESCTLFGFMFARLVKAGGYAVSELCEKFLNGAGLSVFEDTEQVMINKDGKRQRLTIDLALSQLFRLGALSPLQIQLMQNICLLHPLGLSKKQIRRIAEKAKTIPVARWMDALNALIELGYVSTLEDDGTGNLILSDVLDEVITREYPPIIEDAVLVQSLIQVDFFISDYDGDVYCRPVDELERDKARYFYRCASRIFDQADMNINANVAYVLEFFYHHSFNNSQILEVFDGFTTRFVFHVLKWAANNPAQPGDLRIKAYAVLSSYYADATRCGFDPPEDHHIRAMAKCEDCFREALALAKSVQASKEQMDMICAPIAVLMTSPGAYHPSMMSVDVIQAVVDSGYRIANRPNSPLTDILLRALKNTGYQKHWLQSIKNRDSGMEPAERRELYRLAIGKLLCAGNISWNDIDQEHFELLHEFYDVCGDCFSDPSKINVDEFFENTTGMPRNMVLGNAPTRLQVLMSFPTLAAYQQALSEVASRKTGRRPLKMLINRFCRELAFANRPQKIYELVVEWGHLIFCLEQDFITQHRGLMLQLSQRLDVTVSKIIKNFAAMEFVDPIDGAFYSYKDILSPLYAMQTVVHIANDNQMLAELSFEKYLDCLDVNRILNEGFEFGIQNVAVAPWLLHIVNNIHRLGKSELSLIFLMDYTEIIEDNLQEMDTSLKTELYPLYKEIVDRANQGIKNVPMCEERLIQTIFMDDDNLDYHDFPGAETLNWLIPIKREYESKMEELFPKEFGYI